MADEVIKKWPTYKWREEMLIAEEDDVATEYVLTLVVNGEEFATMVCTPTNLHDLVVGFLAAEAIIRRAEDIERMTIDQDAGFAYVQLTNPSFSPQSVRTKRFVGSCCGKSREFYFYQDVKTAKTITTSKTLTAQECLHLMKALQKASGYFKHTGGVHNAALSSGSTLEVIRTDIGRHNALDKIYGHCLKNRVKLKDKVIVFSGRVSSEVLLKAAKIGSGILLSKSAPTDLALKLADDLGLTVVGFIRGQKLNVYTHPQRIREISDSLVERPS